MDKIQLARLAAWADGPRTATDLHHIDRVGMGRDRSRVEGRLLAVTRQQHVRIHAGNEHEDDSSRPDAAASFRSLLELPQVDDG